MNVRLRGRLLALAMIVPLGLGLVAAPAQAAPKQKPTTIAVIHAIPLGKGADVVDVYAGTLRIMNNLQPGQLRKTTLTPGEYDLAIYPDGQGPGNGTALLSRNDVTLLSRANYTLTANLDAAGAPAINLYDNQVTANAPRLGRIVVRHIAAAPAVDFRLGGTVQFGNLVNPGQASASITSGEYSADVVLHGTQIVAIPAFALPVTRPMTTIVYVWGSAADETLRVTIQKVKTRM